MSDKKSDRRLFFKLYGMVSMFLYETLVGIGLGYLIGLGLDTLFGFELLFKAIFMLIGSFAGIRNLIKKALKLQEEIDE